MVNVVREPVVLTTLRGAAAANLLHGHIIRNPKPNPDFEHLEPAHYNAIEQPIDTHQAPSAQAFAAMYV